MRTIEKILRYNFSQEKIQELIREGTVNGCGGKGGFNLSNFIEDNLKYFPNFMKEKSKQFFDDMFLLCVEHDYDFHHKIGLYLANFYFARAFFKLTYWSSMGFRIIGFIAIFLLLNKYGKNYYLQSE